MIFITEKQEMQMVVVYTTVPYRNEKQKLPLTGRQQCNDRGSNQRRLLRFCVDCVTPSRVFTTGWPPPQSITAQSKLAICGLAFRPCERVQSARRQPSIKAPATTTRRRSKLSFRKSGTQLRPGLRVRTLYTAL